MIPIFSLFLPLLTLEVGGNLLEVGIVGGVSYAIYSFMPFVLGKYSDRIRSKRIFVIASFALLTLVSFVYIIVSDPITLIAARLVEGVGWALMWPSIQASLARNSSGETRRILSIYNSVWSGAAAISPVVGGVLATVGSIRSVFYFTTALFALGLVMNVFFFLASDGRDSRNSSVIFSAPDKRTHRPKDMSFYFLAVAIGALSTATLLTFFPPFAKVSGISVLAIGVITTAYGFTRFVFYTLTTRANFRMKVLEERHRIRNTVISLGIIAGSSLFLMLGDSTGSSSFLLFALIGVAYSASNTIGQAAIIGDSHLSNIGAAAGTFESAIGIGAFLGPIIAGIATSNTHISPFELPLFGFVLVVIPYFIAVRRRRKAV